MTTEELSQLLKEHERNDDNRFAQMFSILEKFKDNHFPHLQSKIDKVAVDVDWIKKFFWAIAIPMIGILATLILKK